MSASDLEAIADALGPGGLIRDERERLACARDSWPQALGWSAAALAAHAPATVLRPVDESGAAAALDWAARAKAVLVPRGAGSGVLGAAIPVRPESAVLDASHLRSFELLDGEEPVVHAGAGWLGGELERRLNAHGFSLLNFPQSMEDSSVGGWIATDAFGQLSTRYGGVRAQVRGVRVVGLDGMVRDEDAAPHLGAEGTLGAVTRVTLRVRPLPEGRRFFAYEFADLAEALGWAREAMSGGRPPSVLRLYGPVDAFFNGLKRSGDGSAESEWKLRAETTLLRGARWLNALTPLLGPRWIAIAVAEIEPPFGDAAPPPASGARDLGEGPARRWWDRRYHLSKRRLERVFGAGGFVDTADFWAPWDLLPRLNVEVLGALREHALAFSHLSHFDAGGACLYVTFAGAGGGKRHARAWSAALEAGARTGACVNHHHGVGLGKLKWLDRAWTPERLSAWREEKRRRDPLGLLNPGKLCR